MSICSSACFGAALVAAACSPVPGGADAAGSQVFRIELPPVEQPSATESVRCLHATLPDELGTIARIESTAHSIVHDLAVFLVPAALAPDGTFGEDCDVGDAAVMIHEARGPAGEVVLPPETALDPGRDAAVLVRVHYLNVTERTITAEVVVSLEGALEPAAAVLLGAVYALDPEVPAPPGTASAVVECGLPAGSRLALLTGTGGALVSGIAISDDAQELFATNDWAHPGVTVWPEPYTPSGALRGRCDLVNPSGVTAVERCGIGALVSGTAGLEGCGP